MKFIDEVKTVATRVVADGATEPGARERLVVQLDAKFDALRFEFVATMERGFRLQTWRLVGMNFVAFGLFATLVRLS